MIQNTVNINTRLSIQVALSGFSFKREGVDSDPEIFSERYPSPFSDFEAAEEFFSDRINEIEALREKYREVVMYIDTDRYVLIPSEFYSGTSAEKDFDEVHTLRENERLFTVGIESLDVVLVYAVPDSIYIHFSRIQPSVKYFPLPYRLFEASSKGVNADIYVITEGNRSDIMVVHNCHVELFNSYRTGSFDTVLYYVFAAAEACSLDISGSSVCFCSPISDSDYAKASEYIGNIIRL